MDLIFQSFWSKCIVEIITKYFLLDDYHRMDEMDIPFLFGRVMFFRTEYFKRVGVFDENILMCIEDIGIT